jgi:hypothetical protein
MKSMSKHMGKVDFEETESGQVKAPASSDAPSALKE